MTKTSDDTPHTNRDKKVAARLKRRKYIQGTRAFTHAMTNRIAKRVGGSRDAGK